jgi:hypothetical protein
MFMGSVSPGDAREGALERAAEPYDDVGCSETTTWYGLLCRRRLACCMHELSCPVGIACCAVHETASRLEALHWQLCRRMAGAALGLSTQQQRSSRGRGNHVVLSSRYHAS